MGLYMKPQSGFVGTRGTTVTLNTGLLRPARIYIGVLLTRIPIYDQDILRLNLDGQLHSRSAPTPASARELVSVLVWIG